MSTKIIFKVITGIVFVLILSSLGFVGLNLFIQSEEEKLVTPSVDGVGDENIVSESMREQDIEIDTPDLTQELDISSSTDQFNEDVTTLNIEEERLESDSVPEEETKSVVKSVEVVKFETRSPAQLLEDRRALAKVAYEQEPDLSPEVREAVLNPSPELLDVLVAEFVSGNISGQELEEDFVIIDDWLQEPYYLKKGNSVVTLARSSRDGSQLPLASSCASKLTLGVEV